MAIVENHDCGEFASQSDSLRLAIINHKLQPDDKRVAIPKDLALILDRLSV